MTRFFLFLLTLAPIMLAGNWLLENQGNITIQWFDYTIEISTALAAFALAAVCVIITIFTLLLWQLVNWPERRRARRRTRNLVRGLTHLTHGFTALAMGDEKAASTALKKSRAALPGEPLPQLLTAQLMQRQGKHDEARTYLRALLKHDATALLATHRLIEQHMTRREWPEAVNLAEATHRDTPRDRWLTVTLLDLYARTGNTSRMLALTEGWQFRSPLSRAERHRYAAIAHYLKSQTEEEPRLKLQQLQQATNFAPDFTPAILAYAIQLIADEQPRKARKLLRSAWQKQPSALFIGPILLSIKDGSERQQHRLLNPFLRDPRTAAHYLLEAQFLLDHRKFDEAKPVVEAALALEESKQVCTLMAEVERELRGTQAANGWLARAMDAPASESWICESCGFTHTDWQPHCSSCNAFDSLRYQRPEARITSVEVAKP